MIERWSFDNSPFLESTIFAKVYWSERSTRPSRSLLNQYLKAEDIIIRHQGPYGECFCNRIMCRYNNSGMREEGIDFLGNKPEYIIRFLHIHELHCRSREKGQVLQLFCLFFSMFPSLETSIPVPCMRAGVCPSPNAAVKVHSIRCVLSGPLWCELIRRSSVAEWLSGESALIASVNVSRSSGWI